MSHSFNYIIQLFFLCPYLFIYFIAYISITFVQIKLFGLSLSSLFIYDFHTVK